VEIRAARPEEYDAVGGLAPAAQSEALTPSGLHPPVQAREAL
jgi:hypothetical protein